MGERFPFFRKWTPATESRRNNETNPATGMFPGVRVGMRTHRGCASGNLFELTGKLKSRRIWRRARNLSSNVLIRLKRVKGERDAPLPWNHDPSDKFTRYARAWNGTESPRILGERGWEEKQDLKRNAIRGFLEIVRWTKPAKQSVFKIYGFAEFAICFPNSFNNPINKTNYPRVEKRVRGF